MEEARITRIGKGFSLAIMGVLVAIALTPRISLWGLLELKMELLVQAAPVFVLGLTWPRLSAKAALAGVICGTLLAAGLTLAGYGKIAGVHAGLLGAILNAGISVAGSLASRPRGD